VKQELNSRLQVASSPEAENELLRRLQDRTNERGPDAGRAGAGEAAASAVAPGDPEVRS